jgi:hypothetical protein
MSWRRDQFDNQRSNPITVALGVRRDVDANRDLDLLISDLCIKWGFCSSRITSEALLAGGQMLTADQFAKLIVDAEGAEPDSMMDWRLQISAIFHARYGPFLSADQ